MSAWVVVGALAALLAGYVAGRLHREREDRLSETELAKAFARERSHRERLELPTGNKALVHRIADADRGRFLRMRRG